MQHYAAEVGWSPLPGVARDTRAQRDGMLAVVPTNIPNRNAGGERHDQGRPRASTKHSLVAGNDALLIGERAATRGRIAT